MQPQPPENTPSPTFAGVDLGGPEQTVVLKIVIRDGRAFVASVIGAVSNRMTDYAGPWRLNLRLGRLLRDAARRMKRARRQARHQRLLQGKHGLRRPRGRRNAAASQIDQLPVSQQC